MTDKEKLDAIRAEIHRLVDVRGYDREMANDLFAFMDSLPNEPVSEDLNEAAEGYAVTDEALPNGKVMINFQVKKAFRAGAKWQKEKEYTCYEEAFENGAKWKKEQMMNQIVCGRVIARFPLASDPLYNDVEIYLNFTRGLSEGDKVKVIIIKED